MDLSAFVESLQRGLKELPPIAVALGLLGGPTAALIGYRMVAAAARRRQAAPQVEAVPLWVCRDCRSINDLHASRCYRCGLGPDPGGQVEIIVSRPAARPAPGNVPAGSPFAAAATSSHQRPGVPVMGDREDPVRRVPVGPGNQRDQVQIGPLPEPVERIEAER